LRHFGALALLSFTVAAPALAQVRRCGGGTAQYLRLFNRDTVSAEGVDIAADSVQSQLQMLPGTVLRKHAVTLSSGVIPVKAYVDVWQAGAAHTGPPTQRAVVQFTGGVAQATVIQGSRSQVQLDPVEPGTLPFMSGSMLYLQLIAMRATAAAQDSVRVPLLWLFSGGQVDTAFVTRRGRDSVSIRTGVGEYRFARDADGTLGSGSAVAPAGAPPVDLRFIRVCP
jgi:hypothetical protein